MAELFGFSIKRSQKELGTNEKSFADSVHWIEDIKLCSKNNVSIVLVGNKTDMVNNRVVSY